MALSNLQKFFLYFDPYNNLVQKAQYFWFKQNDTSSEVILVA